MILAISTALAMSITGCGSSKSDATTANTNATDNSTSAESSVDTSAFKDITVEGNNHKVTVKYFEDAYELEAGSLNANGTISQCYVSDNNGSITVTLTSYNVQELTADEAKETMTSNEDMMKYISDLTCEEYSNSNLNGYVQSYVNTTTKTTTRTYVLSDGDFYMYIEANYLLTDPFDLDFTPYLF